MFLDTQFLLLYFNNQCLKYGNINLYNIPYVLKYFLYLYLESLKVPITEKESDNYNMDSNLQLFPH